MPDYTLINPDGSQKLPWSIAGSCGRLHGVVENDSAGAGSGVVGSREARTVHPRRLRRCEMVLAAFGAAETAELLALLAGTARGVLPLRWSPPWEARTTPEAAPRWRLVNGAELETALSRSVGGVSIGVSLSLQEV